jgi:hypothetical protein
MHKKNYIAAALEKQCKILLPYLNEYNSKKDIVAFCQKDPRTPFFMLEGIARIYLEAYGKKPFKKWLEHFKRMEDTLGQIGFYTIDCQTGSLTQKEAEKCSAKAKIYYNRLAVDLALFKWYDGERIAKMQKKASNLIIDNQEVSKIRSVLQDEIRKIIVFHETCDYSNMEEGIHELRRKLRWISIYAQALNGMIQLKKSSKQLVDKKYLTKAIKTSPYNRLPTAPQGGETILFNQDSFYALSWLINELGIIKDKRLVLMQKKDTATRGKPGITLSREAERICRTFFAENHLEKLLVS